MSLHFIHRNQIAQMISKNGRMSFQSIAEQCKLDEDDTRRVLRLAMTNHLFEESENGMVDHSAATQMLSQNPKLAAWIGVLTHECWPSMVQVDLPFSIPNVRAKSVLTLTAVVRCSESMARIRITRTDCEVIGNFRL